MENKFQIVETPDYILAVSDEEIKEGDTIFNYFGLKHNEQVISKASKNAVINWKNDLYINDGTKRIRDGIKKIIAHIPKGNAPELDLPLLPEIVVEDDVEKLLDEKYPYEVGYSVSDENSTIQAMREAFIEGHKAATKVYSEEDLKNAFIAGMEFIAVDPSKYQDDANEYTQSLKQPKTPNWFVAEHTGKCCGNQLINQCIDCKKYEPIPKTTTINGKTYLVGKYENK